jgi:flagellar basal body-associated protein FliL
LFYVVLHVSKFRLKIITEWIPFLTWGTSSSSLVIVIVVIIVILIIVIIFLGIVVIDFEKVADTALRGTVDEYDHHTTTSRAGGESEAPLE